MVRSQDSACRSTKLVKWTLWGERTDLAVSAFSVSAFGNELNIRQASAVVFMGLDTGQLLAVFMGVYGCCLLVHPLCDSSQHQAQPCVICQH